MQGSLDGDNSAGARKALAKVQKMLQLVSAKRHALALRDYRETLDECLKPEASATMKILAYRMAARVPTCTTHDVWQLLLDASVTELASSQNALVLLHSIPILEQIPLPLVIGFLISSEKDPMNKLRAVLQHEQSDVRCCAIASLARVTLDAAVAIANDGLFAFPFDSHESRIVCQQDLWTIIADVWKIIFQSLSLEHAGYEQPQDADVAGAAFAALRMLFARTAAMAPFHILQAQTAAAHAHHRTAAYSAANDLAAAMYKEAFPRVRMLVQCAQRLPMKHQVDAAWWLAMLLSMMMDRSGAKCPGLSIACLEIDVLRSNPQDDDDDESRATTERVRVDYLASGVLEAWLLPLVGRKIPLAQSVALCRALFILLSHPLLTFTRLRTVSTLVQQLVAQCFFHKGTDVKLEMSHLLVRAFAWVSSSECLGVFPRVAEAVHLMERETYVKWWSLRMVILLTVSLTLPATATTCCSFSWKACAIAWSRLGTSCSSSRSRRWRSSVSRVAPPSSRHGRAAPMSTGPWSMPFSRESATRTRAWSCKSRSSSCSRPLSKCFSIRLTHQCLRTRSTTTRPRTSCVTSPCSVTTSRPCYARRRSR
jgi:hypothetical protein